MPVRNDWNQAAAAENQMEKEDGEDEDDDDEKVKIHGHTNGCLRFKEKIYNIYLIIVIDWNEANDAIMVWMREWTKSKTRSRQEGSRN